MASEWFVSRNGKKTGPYATKALKELAANGELSRDDLVQKSGIPDWIKAKSVKGLFTSPVDETFAVQEVPVEPPQPPPPVHVPTVVVRRPKKRKRSRAAVFLVPALLVLICGGSLVAFQHFRSNKWVASAANALASDAPGPSKSPLDDFKATMDRSLAAGPSKGIEFKDASFDVEKTSSLVSPYAATLSSNVIVLRANSNPHRGAFKAVFAFQHGEWFCKKITLVTEDELALEKYKQFKKDVERQKELVTTYEEHTELYKEELDRDVKIIKVAVGSSERKEVMNNRLFDSPAIPGRGS